MDTVTVIWLPSRLLTWSPTFSGLAEASAVRWTAMMFPSSTVSLKSSAVVYGMSATVSALR